MSNYKSKIVDLQNLLETEELEFNKRKNKILADIQREKNLENM